MAEHGARALQGEALVSLSAAFGARVACNLELQVGTALGASGDAVEEHKARCIEFGAAGAEQNWAGAGGSAQTILAGAGAGGGRHIDRQHDLGGGGRGRQARLAQWRVAGRAAIAWRSAPPPKHGATPAPVPGATAWPVCRRSRAG